MNLMDTSVRIKSFSCIIIIIYTQMGVISSESARACYTDPTRIERTILCEDYEFIEIQSVKVGYSLQDCNSESCPQHELAENSDFFIYLDKQCRYTYKCTLSSIDLFTKFSNHSFGICGHGGRARNSVWIEYNCTNYEESTRGISTEVLQDVTSQAVVGAAPSSDFTSTQASAAAVTTERKVKINRETAAAISADDSEKTNPDDMLVHILVPLLSLLWLTSIVILVVCIIRVKRLRQAMSNSPHTSTTTIASVSVLDDELWDMKEETDNYYDEEKFPYALAHQNVHCCAESILRGESCLHEMSRRELHRIEELSENESNNSSMKRAQQQYSKPKLSNKPSKQLQQIEKQTVLDSHMTGSILQTVADNSSDSYCRENKSTSRRQNGQLKSKKDLFQDIKRYVNERQEVMT